MKPSLFSIIVPVYNVEKYLSKCIDSVLAQTFIDFECILINDGSTDESPLICDKYSLLDNRIKVIHKENGGLSDARNTGILNSTGEYIVLLDSDDILSNNKALLNLVNIIKKTNAKIVFNGIYTTFSNNEDEFDSSEQFFGDGEYYNPVTFYHIIMNNDKIILAGWLFIVQRDFLLKNNLFFKRGILHEDELWIPFVICYADTITINHNPFYSYRKNRENSIMSELNPKMLIDKQTIINNIQSNKSFISKKLQFILEDRCIMLWHTIFDTVFFLDKKYAAEKRFIIKEMNKQKKVLFHGRKIKNYIYFFLISFVGSKNTYHLRKKSRIFRKERTSILSQ
jgi:glycosyltransferase involved in cell wall biosynthesis